MADLSYADWAAFDDGRWRKLAPRERRRVLSLHALAAYTALKTTWLDLS